MNYEQEGLHSRRSRKHDLFESDFDSPKNSGDRTHDDRVKATNAQSGLTFRNISIALIGVGVLLLVAITVVNTGGIYDTRSRNVDNFEISHTRQDNGGVCVKKNRAGKHGNIILYEDDKESCETVCYSGTAGLCRTLTDCQGSCSYCVGQNCTGLQSNVSNCPQVLLDSSLADRFGLNISEVVFLQLDTTIELGVCKYRLSTDLLSAITLPECGVTGNDDFCQGLLDKSHNVSSSCVTGRATDSSAFTNCIFSFDCATNPKTPLYEDVFALRSSGIRLEGFFLSFISILFNILFV